jgi:short-subunit dehydrogenase
MKNPADYGPWALVTGASSGIGEQFARILGGMGLNLLLTARDQDRLAAIAADIRQSSSVEVDVLAADLAAEGVVEEILDWTANYELGLLVSNAGFGLKGLHETQRAQDLRAMLQVNCHAPTLLAHGLLPRFRQRPCAGIIITGSIEGFVAFPWSTAYAASKAYVRALGEGLAWECRDSGIAVEVLCPGSTDTPALVKQGFDADKMAGVMAPSDVASQALAQLGNRTIFVPGRGNRFLGWLLSNLPRGVAVNFAGNAMKQAISAQQRGS